MPKINRHQLTHAWFLHGNTIDHVNRTHRHFIVRNNNKLRVVTKLADHVREFTNIGIIQWSIHLIKDTEWSWFQ